MTEEKKQVLRLFKVAKELNVGSSTLVDHLRGKGFSDVENNPNQKLTPDMYQILLKDFASEKVLKEKAEQMKEAKREKTHAEESAGDEEDPISAEALKSGVLDKNPDNRGKSVPKVETPRTVVTPPVTQPAAEKQPPVQEEPQSGLRVVAKIDLSQFDKGKGKSTPKEEKKPVREERKENEQPRQEPPVVKAQPPVAEEKPRQQPEEKPAAEQKPVKEEKPPVVVETPPVPEVKEPVAEQKPVAEAAPEAPAESTENKVISGADSAPRLKGLSVKGKIDLSSLQRKKDKPATQTGTGDAGADGDAKKKRRRKRRKTGGEVVNPGAGQQQQGQNRPQQGQNRGKNAPRPEIRPKAEPTEKEIQDQIRNTLAELNKKSGRDRQRMRRAKRDEGAQRRELEAQRLAEESHIIEVTEFITTNELAQAMNIPVTQVIAKCMEIGLFVSINQRLEADIIQMLAEEYGYSIKFVDVTEAVDEEEDIDDDEDLVTRPPIITVMGHVDHGKTSLLDYIRKANVIAGEAGGITQHIGAYAVKLADGRRITFLDTPGHEAFTAMRARGAKVTDLVIIVIAADDAVMPQTREAINHAEAAGVPIVFAINKVDKPGANSERIREQLAQMNYLVEDWGGKFQCQEISAKFGKNVDLLLEKVLLEAEMLNLRANPEREAKGTVIEARLDKGRGVVTTMLVQNGTIRVGDCLVAGVHFSKVRALMDERGNRIKEAGPATPVQILGLTGVPAAGDRFVVYETEREAKEIATKRQELYREQALRRSKHITLDEIARRKAQGNFQELNIIVKGDVDGSVEALADSLLKLGNNEVKVNVIMKGVGQISESDVLLASASDAVIIGFQVRPSASARKLAENETIDIRLYSIIYDAINDVKDALEGMLSPTVKEEILGTIEIREVFRISKVGAVAGCMVTDGKVLRTDPVRLIRDGVVIFTGKLSSLKRFKDDVKEVSQGFECGLTVDGYNDIKVGDLVESFRASEVKRTLS